MIARNDSTPIVVPRQCTNPAFLGDFSRDVISAIKGLRDRRVIYNAPRLNLPDACPLTPYIVGNIEDDFQIYVTGGISGDFVPTFGGSPVGTDNKQDMPGSPSLYLKITWTPGVDYDDTDNVYLIAAGGTHVSSEFILEDTRPTDSEAEVDSATGATTDGEYHFLWGEIDWTLPPPRFTGQRCGNHQITFCPGSLRLLFD
jgi:hypothetical protein